MQTQVDALKTTAKPTHFAPSETQRADDSHAAFAYKDAAVGPPCAGPLKRTQEDRSKNHAARFIVCSLCVAGTLFAYLHRSEAHAPAAAWGSGEHEHPHGLAPTPGAVEVSAEPPRASGSGSGSGMPETGDLERELKNLELSEAFDRLKLNNRQLQAIFENNELVGNGAGRGRQVGGGISMTGRARVQNGFLTAEQVEKVVRRHKSAIKYCYERALVNDPTLSGRIEMQWTVGRDGKVKTASVSENTMGSRTVADCILSEVPKMHFDQPARGIVLVAYPFTFRSAEE